MLTSEWSRFGIDVDSGPWCLEPCGLCSFEILHELVMRKYGKRYEVVDKSGELSGEDRAGLGDEADRICLKLGKKNTEEYVALRNRELERALLQMTSETGSPLFPFDPKNLELCTLHRVKSVYGKYASNFFTMIYYLMKVTKKVRYQDFDPFGIERREIRKYIEVGNAYLKQLQNKQNKRQESNTEP